MVCNLVPITADDDAPSPRIAKNDAQMKAVLALLDADELLILAGVIFDDESQLEISVRLSKSRRWVSWKMHRGLKKLAAAGVVLSPPRKGRRSTREGKMRYVEPTAMDQLRVEGERAGGQHRGTWSVGRRKRKRLSSDE